MQAVVGSKGAGDLAITSQQDEDHYIAREQSWGINASIPLPGATAAPSLGISSGDLNLLADYQAVREQSAINAGTGGFNIAVNGHTHLRGGAITSEAGGQASSRLVTQTLSHETLQNKDVSQGRGWSVSLAVGNKDQDGLGLGLSSAGYARIDTNRSSATPSSVAGTVTVSRPDLQAGRIAAVRAGEQAPLQGQRAAMQQIGRAHV